MSDCKSLSVFEMNESRQLTECEFSCRKKIVGRFAHRRANNGAGLISLLNLVLNQISDVIDAFIVRK